MVQFEQKLATQRFPDWETYYLNYKLLKQKLDPILSSLEEHDTDQLLAAEAEFIQSLDIEIEKVVLFFLEKQGLFATRLALLRDEQRGGAAEDATAVVSHLNLRHIRELADKYREVGSELVRLVHFVELNATGLRKILKKHDKNNKTHKLSKSYLSVCATGEDSHLQQLYHYGGIASLVTTLRAALVELRDLEESLLEAEEQQESLSGTRRGSFSTFEPILGKIKLARHRLSTSTRYVKTIAAQALLFEGTSEDEEEEERVRASEYETFPQQERPSENMSKFLNLMSTFLYMTNYYIVAPTSGLYAEKLGCSPALSGIIVGMTPIAALVSAVLYSWWANFSYKSALLFASTCSLVGNLLYAVALPLKSVELVIAGRIFNGFGGARAINRRYIADTYPREERTSASAAFVTAGALGMAAGPATAAILGRIPDNYSSYLAVENAPGWLMFFVWCFYLVAIVVSFRDPHKASAAPVTKAETQPLLAPTASELEAAAAPIVKRPSLLTNVPVMITLTIYFLLKLVLECLLTSTASLTSLYFDWSMTWTGIYLAILGLLMFPANICVANLSYRFDDRELIMGSMVWMFLGICGFIKYSTTYSSIQYIFFGICIFLSTNVLEGVNMSLLSKTIPKYLAKGTFNSGLLATEAGTSGRAVGDLVIALVGLVNMQYILNWTFIPLAGLTLVMLLVVWKYYPHLEAVDDDEDY